MNSLTTRSNPHPEKNDKPEIPGVKVRYGQERSDTAIGVPRLTGRDRITP
jgi:hypothetical protein